MPYDRPTTKRKVPALKPVKPAKKIANPQILNRIMRLPSPRGKGRS